MQGASRVQVSMSFLNDLLATVGARGRALVGLGAARPPEDLGPLAAEVLSGRGEASGTALAAELNALYAAASTPARAAFLRHLAERHGPPEGPLREAATAYLADPSPAAASALHERAEPRRQELFRRLNRAPGGTLALVRMREDLMALRAEAGDDAALAAMDGDFAHLLGSWFNRGFLVLRRLDWSSPGHVLDSIIRYEAVHAIRGYDDLRRRLAPTDRRLYAFFHPALGDEPLVFVEVALARGIPSAIAPVLAEGRDAIPAAEATTAVFYSISNCQRGLAGVSFGNFLIKQVVEELRRDLPNLTTFVTLSPVPGFRRWLDAERADEGSSAVPREDALALAVLDQPGWPGEAAAAEAARRAILPAAAQYLLRARDAKGRPLDPVARFHLGNGARLERLNPLGDPSPAGLMASHGLMVNYLYDPDSIEANHEAFARGEAIAAPAARRHLRGERGALARIASPSAW